jgi:hypothetical protein
MDMEINMMYRSMEMEIYTISIENMASYAISLSLILVIHDDMVNVTNHIA